MNKAEKICKVICKKFDELRERTYDNADYCRAHNYNLEASALGYRSSAITDCKKIVWEIMEQNGWKKI